MRCCFVCSNIFFVQAIIEMSRTFGQKEEETWLPFQSMVRKYGLAELMRRIQKGSISARKDPDDEDEWQFRDIVVTKYMDNQEKTTRAAEKSGRMDLETWMTLKSKSMANKAFEPDEGDPTLINFLKSNGSKKEVHQIKDSKDPEAKVDEEDSDLQKAEKLSQLGGAGVKAKAKMEEMIALGKKMLNDLGDKDLKNMLKKKLGMIEKMKNEKVRIDDVKAVLIDVYTTMKKVKKAEKA